MLVRMRKLAALALVVAAACGGKKSPGKDDGGHPGSDGSDAPKDGPQMDAPALAACTPVNGTTVSTRLVGKVNGGATLATSPPNDGRLFVLEQNGAIRIIDNTETLLTAPFLDISDAANTCTTIKDQTACTARTDCRVRFVGTTTTFKDCVDLVSAGGELGLLGLAFSPSYATNRQFYVDFTSPNPQFVSGGEPFVDTVVRYTASATDPNVADPTSATVILSIPDPFSNHNGGMIEFGPDGFLYISTGDGGSAGDPKRNAQNPDKLLGKMLRIDVEHPGATLPYSIPADNPFANGGGAPEVFMLGLRNPWRWTFDRGTGDMWIGDVGQGQIEELDVVPAGTGAGKNFGWSAFEGTSCCETQADACAQTNPPPDQVCDSTGKTFAQVEHTHASGWEAIIGGQVYRGTCYPDLVGTYFYDDNNHRKLTEATFDAGTGTVTSTELPGAWPTSPSSIHADARGELYLTNTNGEVYHIEAGP